METNKKLIELKCPICQTEKTIKIPEALFSQKKFGTVKIQIPIGAVCPDHQFIVFLDNNGKVKSYEKIDFHLTLSNEEKSKDAADILTLKKLIQIFGLYGVFSLVHAKVFNYPVYIIKDKNFEFDENLLNLIGDKILPEMYQGTKTIYLLKESDYNNDLNEIDIDKNALLIDTHQNIFQTPWDIKLKFEESIVTKALEILNEEEQLFVMKNYITQIIKEAESAKDILKDEDIISEKDLKKRIMRELNVPKVSNYRFKIIKEFIKCHYSPDLIFKIK
ncbi:MAG: hypothetical protein ACFFAN_14515 [Promethearchaeota archaeon]